jgi:CHAT domain-containing protein
MNKVRGSLRELAAALAVLVLSSPTPAQAPAQHLLRPGAAVRDAVGADAVTIDLSAWGHGIASGVRVSVVVEETGTYHVELSAPLFDAFLVLRDPTGEVLASGDDAAASFDAHITSELVAGEEYVLEACAPPGQVGPFELRCSPGQPPELPPERVADEQRAEVERRRAAIEAACAEDPLRAAAQLERLVELVFRKWTHLPLRDLNRRTLELRLDAAPRSPATAVTLLWLSSDLERELGERDDARAEARDLADRAIELVDTLEVGPQTDTDTLRRLAETLQGRGEHARSVRVRLRRLELLEAEPGADELALSYEFGGLARQLQALGRYAEARAHYDRALSLSVKTLGEHMDTSWALEGLGFLMQTMGDYEAALEHFGRAAAMREELSGPDGRHVGRAHYGVAVALMSLGRNDEARATLERVLAIDAKHLGLDSPEIRVLDTLGDLLIREGDYEGAREYLWRAHANRERAYGAEHPALAPLLFSLGLSHQLEGDYESALRLKERAAAIEDRSASVWGRARWSLAVLYIDLEQPERAWEVVREDHEAHFAAQVKAMEGMNDAERMRFVGAMAWSLWVELSAALALDEPDVERGAYESVLAWKGRVARAQLASRERLRQRMTEERRRLRQLLRAAQSELAEAALRRDVVDGESHEESLNGLREECRRIESELQRDLAEDEAVTYPVFADVAAALPPRSAAVDFYVHPIRRPLHTEGEAGARLSAWVTLPGDGAPRYVNLGPADELEATVRAFLDDLVARRGTALGEESSGDELGSRVREQLWDPLATHLAGVETLFVSPDGFLGALPFETIPWASGGRLIEHCGVVYVQDVTSLGAPAPTKASSSALLSVGGVDFQRGDAWAPPDAGSSSLDRGGLSRFWGRLPATEYEAQVVADLHAATFGAAGEQLLLQGAVPGEERLKFELPRHDVLHLATHGFFEPQGVPSMWADGASGWGLSEGARHLIAAHPGLLSGLVLAGANERHADREDGYLTAEEIRWLDLSGAELVVLSACETGLGEARSGEGMLGLRRAFHVAGAATVVSSLWSVKDESTTTLMQGFYENLWLRGAERLEALRQAQLDMLRANRIEHGRDLPSTWGGFVLSGEWR